MSGAPTAPRRRPRLVTRLALVLVALVAAPLAGEALYRVWCRVQGAPYRKESAADEILGVVHSMNQPVPLALDEEPGADLLGVTIAHEPHPFYGYEVPAQQDVIATQIARLARADADERYWVLVVGGSVAAMLGELGGERVAELLGAAAPVAGRDVEVLNHGRGGFKQPQQLMLVAHLFSLGLVPDAVINVDGFNEVALGNHNATLGVHPSYPHWPRWGNLSGAHASDPRALDLFAAIWTTQREVRELAERVLNSGWHASALVGRWTAWRARVLRARWGELQARYLEALGSDASRGGRGPAFDASPDAALRTIVDGWEDASRSLRGLCAAHGVAYLHVLQPTLHDAGSKSLTAEELAVSVTDPAWKDGVVRGYPLLEERARALAAEGFPIADLTGVFTGVSETLYFDVCHFGAEGNRLFAEAIAQELAARL